jgi:hypothetical protein
MMAVDDSKVEVADLTAVMTSPAREESEISVEPSQILSPASTAPFAMSDEATVRQEEHVEPSESKPLSDGVAQNETSNASRPVGDGTTAWKPYQREGRIPTSIRPHIVQFYNVVKEQRFLVELLNIYQQKAVESFLGSQASQSMSRTSFQHMPPPVGLAENRPDAPNPATFRPSHPIPQHADQPRAHQFKKSPHQMRYPFSTNPHAFQPVGDRAQAGGQSAKSQGIAAPDGSAEDAALGEVGKDVAAEGEGGLKGRGRGKEEEGKDGDMEVSTSDEEGEGGEGGKKAMEVAESL